MPRKARLARPVRKREPIDRLFVRPQEAGDIVGFSRSKVYELMKAGQLPVVYFGGTARISVPALRRLAEGE